MGRRRAFPNGCHIAEVEVDPDTGVVDVVKYTFVNDFGVVINPLLVDGQAHGGIVQGIGQALCESTVYDDDGQLLTGSYMDYAMPRAEDAPLFRHEFHSVPATTNPLGAKGCGEAPVAGALPSVNETAGRRPQRIRHPPYRHACHPATRLAGHPRRQVASPVPSSGQSRRPCAGTPRNIAPHIITYPTELPGGTHHEQHRSASAPACARIRRRRPGRTAGGGRYRVYRLA